MVDRRIPRLALVVIAALGCLTLAATTGAVPAGATGTVAVSFSLKVDGSLAAATTTTAPTSTINVAGLPRRATGTVTIDQAGNPLCTVVLPKPYCTTGILAPATYPDITGTYSGDSQFLGAVSDNTVTLTVAVPGTTTTCTKLSGDALTTIDFTFCQASHLGAATAGPDLSTGGTLHWRAGGTTTYSGSATSPGQGSCATGRTEEDFTGTVTADTSTFAPVGGVVSYQYCQGAKGLVRLVPGTTAAL